MDALGINASGLLAQIVNFLLLLIILRAFAYKPILAMLDNRAARIKQSIEDTRKIKEQLARAETEYAERLQQARQEGQAIVAQANQVAERLRADAQSEARKMAEDFLEKARVEIERDKRQAVSELRKEVADLAILAASKVVQRSLDKQSHLRLIEEVIASSGKE